MSDESRIQELVEEIMESGRAPEEVCAQFPQLLYQVVEHLGRVQAVEAQIDAMFPPSGEGMAARRRQLLSADDSLPNIPGYQVEAILGWGGVGVVYRARHLKLNRHVALKMLLSGAYADPRELARFAREARVVAGLHHANIVQVYDVGEFDGKPYFTMEFMEGGSLSQKLAGTPQPAAEAALLLETLATAAQVAHACGIVHRDIKPSNILLAADGTPKLTDFGLARSIAVDATLTEGGAHVGTPSYMAPEQALGRASAICPATDVYGLGAVLYELMTGRPPFRAESPSETERQLVSNDPVAPSRLNAKVPRDLETICLKCLEKDPARRYATAAALAEDVSRFRRGEPIAARPTGRVARALKWIRRRPATAIALVTGAITATTLLSIVLWVITDRAATSRSVTRELDDAVRHQQSGNWSQANAALERAKLRLGSSGPKDLRVRFEQVGRDAELVPRLDAIRMGHAFNKGNVLAFADADRDYEATFRQLGFGSGEAPAHETGSRIKQSPVQRVLIDALYDWLGCTADEGRIKWLQDVAEAASPADASGWRAAALNPKALRDQKDVAALLADPAFDRQPVSLLLVVAKTISKARLEPRKLLLHANRTHPEDFWLNIALGDEMYRAMNYPEAIRYYQVARAIRPDVALGSFDLGLALAAANRPLEAIDEYRDALKVSGDASAIRANLAVALSMAGRHEEACREFEVALKQVPLMARYDGAYAYSLMGVGRDSDAVQWAVRAVSKEPTLAVEPTPAQRVLMHAAQWEQIQTAWRASLQGESAANHEAWRGYAEFSLFRGDVSEYRRACQEQLNRFSGIADSAVGEGIARACLLAEPSEDGLRRATALVDRLLAGEQRERTWRYPYFMLIKALAEFRAGRAESALLILDGPAVGALEPARRIIAALAHAKLGHAKPAMTNLTLGVLAFDWSPSRADSREAWMYHALRQEADRVILPDLPRFLRGEYEPKDDFERLAMSAKCQFQELHAARARLLARVVDSSPELAAQFRRFAVIPAAMAGCGIGKDAPTLVGTDRERWLARARQWVREELAAATAASGAEQTRARARMTLAAWLAASDLACVRDAAALSRLPTAEQQEWKELWEQAAQAQ